MKRIESKLNRGGNGNRFIRVSGVRVGGKIRDVDVIMKSEKVIKANGPNGVRIF